MGWILLLALAALVAAVVAAARRGLANLQDSREDAWQALESQLEKRHAHMIQVVGLCARLMKYESDTLDRVTNSGSAVIAAAESLFRLSANYPQFGTSRAFKALHQRAVTLDARVDERREQYNGVVGVLNVRCRAFPYSIVARTMGMRPAAYLS
jgi:hypothetical protein